MRGNGGDGSVGNHRLIKPTNLSSKVYYAIASYMNVGWNDQMKDHDGCKIKIRKKVSFGPCTHITRPLIHYIFH